MRVNGAGKPSDTLGNTGDMYVDTTAVQLYIKIDHCTWQAAGVSQSVHDALDARVAVLEGP
jgi:hypothetical protein